MISQIQTLQEKARQRRFQFVLVGRAGVGKSSTINTLMGEDIALVGKFISTTKEIKKYDLNINNIPFTLIDTLGLADGQVDDQKSIAKIKSEVTTYDCMWFITKLNETRVRNDEVSTINNISLAFGEEGWKKAIIVFTHADKIEEHEYQEYLYVRTRDIKEKMANYIDKNILQGIPSIAIANDSKGGKSKCTPDGKTWLGNLYTKNIQQIEAKGLLPLFMSTAERLIPEEDTANQEYLYLLDLKQEPILVSNLQLASIGARIKDNPDFAEIKTTENLGDELKTDNPQLRKITNSLKLVLAPKNLFTENLGFSTEGNRELEELQQEFDKSCKEQGISICSNFLKVYKIFKGAADVESFIAENVEKAKPEVVPLYLTYPASEIQEKLAQTVIISYYKSKTLRSLATNIILENDYLKVELEDILGFLDPSEDQSTENIPDFTTEIIVFAVYCQEDN